MVSRSRRDPSADVVGLAQLFNFHLEVVSELKTSMLLRWRSVDVLVGTITTAKEDRRSFVGASQLQFSEQRRETVAHGTRFRCRGPCLYMAVVKGLDMTAFSAKGRRKRSCFGDRLGGRGPLVLGGSRQHVDIVP
jgi:hypothetical protein